MKFIQNPKWFSIILTLFILSWTTLPSISLAFISPGQPIQYGEAISTGTPINGGVFIVPGEVLQPGEALKPGESYKAGQGPSGGNVVNGGKPILQNSPIFNGRFIIPNAPPPPPFLYFNGKAYIPGESITGGTPSTPGTSTSGAGIEGGTSGSLGSTSSIGTPNSGSSPIDGGQIGQNGDVINGGNNPENGSVISGDNGSTGGNASEVGDVLLGGDSSGPSESFEGNGEGSASNNVGSGEVTEGNPLTNSNDSPPSGLNLIFNSTDGSKGILGQIVGGAKDVNNYILDFGDKVAQASAANFAGFKFNDLGNGKYSISGKEKLNNKVTNWFYQRFKQYKYEGENVFFGPKSRRIGTERLNAFLESKKLGGSAGGWGNAKNAAIKSINDSWNITSKGFWKGSNIAKLSGPVNVALSAFSSVYDYGFGTNTEKRSKGLLSTDFAAALTTDVAIGVGTTAISSMAGSMAAGAVAGSVVPGLGTIIGAVVGLSVGLISTQLINGTATGRKLKAGATSLIKKGYDFSVNLAKSTIKSGKEVGTIVKNSFSSVAKGIGGLFG